VLGAALLLTGGFPATDAGLADAAPRELTVDGDASTIRVLVYRRGALAVLAHDHVLVARSIAGRISFDADQPAAAAAQITIPVAFLDVDDPAARKREGFRGDLSESDRASVRENMLSAEQLDEAGSPRIALTVERAEGSLPDLRLRLRVRVRQQERTLEIPVQAIWAGDVLTVSGEARLLQSAFGIVPYSTLLGAIAVEDEVRVKFEIVARPEAP
jgi:polyisoprenoid-binding protein YceI